MGAPEGLPGTWLTIGPGRRGTGGTDPLSATPVRNCRRACGIPSELEPGKGNPAHHLVLLSQMLLEVYLWHGPKGGSWQQEESAGHRCGRACPHPTPWPAPPSPIPPRLESGEMEACATLLCSACFPHGAITQR